MHPSTSLPHLSCLRVRSPSHAQPLLKATLFAIGSSKKSGRRLRCCRDGCAKGMQHKSGISGSSFIHLRFSQGRWKRTTLLRCCTHPSSQAHGDVQVSLSANAIQRGTSCSWTKRNPRNPDWPASCPDLRRNYGETFVRFRKPVCSIPPKPPPNLTPSFSSTPGHAHLGQLGRHAESVAQNSS
jgi:hypothetical protein